MDLQDKTALVTGGGSGIGLGIALALAREGCRVAITGRDPKRLEAAANQFDGRPPVLARSCDVSDRAAVDSLFSWLEEEWGPIEILVNSAGINVPNRGITELTPEDWDRMLAINVTGAFNCIYAALPGMRGSRSGLIINISSIAGKRAMKLGGAGYCASKFAMTASPMSLSTIPPSSRIGSSMARRYTLSRANTRSGSSPSHGTCAPGR